MLLLYIFVCIYNFCVEKTEGNCKSKCTGLPEDATILNHLPTFDDVSELSEEYNVFVSESVEWSRNAPTQSYKEFTICEDSVEFIFDGSVNYIVLSSQIIANKYAYIPDLPAPIKFNINKNITLMIESSEERPQQTIILEAAKPDLFITTEFLTDIFDSNKILISEVSNQFNIFDLSENTKSLFADTNKLMEISKSYFCISDQTNKCSDYSQYNPTIINSPSEVTGDSVVLIVESKINQIYDKIYTDRYIKFIGLEGSHIIYKVNSDTNYFDGDFHVIINQNDITMSNSKFEGQGSFTLDLFLEISLHATTDESALKFTLKSIPNTYIFTQIHQLTYSDFKPIDLVNKINVPEFSYFWGSNDMTGYFENGKYIIQKETTSISKIADLEPSFIEGLYYSFNNGDYEIPITWDKTGYFKGNKQETANVNLIFRNPHSFDGNVDNYINLCWIDVTFYPKDFFSFSFPNDKIHNINFVIDGDVIINNPSISDDEKDDNNGRSRNIKADINCNFAGSGKVKFVQSSFRSQIEGMCTKEETVSFEDYTSELPNYYVCIGQSDLEKCKAEIENVESITDVTWIWLVNIKTLDKLKNIKKAYITNKQIADHSFSYDIILTKNADLTIFEFLIVIKTDAANNIIAQAKTSKLTFVVRNNFFIMKYEAAPTNIDLRIYFDFQVVNLFLMINTPNDYAKNSIIIEGNCAIYVKNYILTKRDIFSKPDSIVFVEDTNPSFDCICCSDNVNDCFVIEEDFLHITNLDEVVDIEIDEIQVIYTFKPLTLSMDLNPNFCFYFMKGSSLTLNVPEKVRINYFLSDYENGIEAINQNKKSMFFLFGDDSIEITLEVKSSLYLDAVIEIYEENLVSIPKVTFKTELNSIEIIPSIDFNTKIHEINPEYKIIIPEGLSITSPMPEYLESIIEVSKIDFSGICVYLNEEGKSLCGSKNSKSITDAQKEDLNANIIITTGIDVTFSMPSSWTTEHYLYFIRPDSVKLSLSDVHSLWYYSDGIKINDKHTIIACNLSINVPSKLSFNVDLPKGFPIYSYLYYCYLDCGSNSQTDIYAGYLSVNQDELITPCIHVGGYDIDHKLTVYCNKEDDLHELYGVAQFYGDEEGMNYKFGGFNYICYASSDESQEKCIEPNYYLISDISSLINAVNSYPNLQIFLTKDLTIPESTGKSFLLKASDESIEVVIQAAPKSIEISENNQVQCNYKDNTYVKTLNKMNIVVNLKDNVELSVSDVLHSKMEFVLNSDVFISTNTKITQDFTINVVKNGFHLYSDSIKDFGSIFGDALDTFNKICAYETGADSLCTCNKKDTIENVFKSPFNYKEVEIAFSSNSKEITLPNILQNVNIVLRYENTKSLVINSVSSIQMNNKKVILNEYWTFNEKTESLIIKLNKQSSLSIQEKILSPITLQLTDSDTIIDLKDCVNQDSKQITLNKSGEKESTVTVLGSVNAFNNFKSLLISYEGINIKQNDDKKYACICKDDSCNKCKEGIDGNVITYDSIKSDPGENVEIRVFLDIEVASNIFTNEHNVLINSLNNLIINNVQNVSQNIENKLKVDNLIVENGNNLLIKPKPSTLYITMAKEKAGPEFTIEFSTYLILKITNANEDGIAASKLKVKGNGELNLYDYPSDKVDAESTIKVIKGIYVICNSKAEGSVCAYQTVNNYKVINSYDNFTNTFDKESKILVILDTYTSNLDVEINRLSHQSLMFIKQGFPSKLLESNAKVRFLSTSILTNKADYTTELEGSRGGVSLNNDDSDCFIVAFDDKLTIKQEGNIENTLKTIVIQPLNDKASIVIDKNVKIDHQQLRIETDKEKLDLTVFVGDKPTNDENINKFIDISEENKDKVNVIIKKGEPEETENPPPKKNGLKPGQIAGIVVGVVAFVAIVIVVVIIIIKKKKSNDHSSTEVSDQE